MATVFPPPVIPARFVRLDDDQPRAHCSVRQVLGLMRGGTFLDRMRDPDGTLATFTEEIRRDVIPEVSSRAVKLTRLPFDWCRAIEFDDGSGGNKLGLTYRNVAFVNALFVRILPSMQWYRFTRFRNTDGSEFNRVASFVEPPPVAPYRPGTGGTTTPVLFVGMETGVEDAEIYVDTAAGILTLPPRALMLSSGFPLASFSFMGGNSNIEVHYTFGYAPTSYESGAPLAFDATTGALADPNPAIIPPAPPDPVDWSSGIPAGLSRAVARLATIDVLRMYWRGLSMGFGSISVDGASESYGGAPFGGDLDREEEAVTKIITSFGKAVG